MGPPVPQVPGAAPVASAPSRLPRRFRAASSCRCPTTTKASARRSSRLTAVARDELAQTLGVPAPPRVTLRFHPTTDDYERATGQPWFTSEPR